MLIPPLPCLNDKLHTQMRGPTVYSNWVIPGMLMAGAYPGALDDQLNDQILRSYLSRGVDTFVCLQAELDPDVPEDAWRAGRGLRPYLADAERLSKKPVKWVHVAIQDGGVAPDEVMEDLTLQLVQDLNEGRILYVHCWGGHGRTGVVVCLLLAYLYRITAIEALRRVQRYHDCRIDPQDAKSPQTVVQREQVRRLVQRLLVVPPPTAIRVAQDARQSPARLVMMPERERVLSQACPDALTASAEREVQLPALESRNREYVNGKKCKPREPNASSQTQAHEGELGSLFFAPARGLAGRRQPGLRRSFSAAAAGVRQAQGRVTCLGSLPSQRMRKSFEARTCVSLRRG
eukprot:TRINITY_DN19715_c0_g2_i1.p1 TRINITY_DN19715_c0_g2~~TRINITY_DN19715_c0_g2_i1.p1  ORF type:complete len:347 (-),score=43.18 TRINITY_DN19715_c0_g2_i1:98-1138(-)